MVDISDVALMLYKGTYNVEAECKDVVNENREQITTLSKEVALQNKAFFRENLVKKLDGTHLNLIKEID